MKGETYLMSIVLLFIIVVPLISIICGVNTKEVIEMAVRIIDRSGLKYILLVFVSLITGSVMYRMFKGE